MAFPVIEIGGTDVIDIDEVADRSISLRLQTLDLTLVDPTTIPSMGDTLTCDDPPWEGIVTSIRTREWKDVLFVDVTATNEDVATPDEAPFGVSDTPNDSTTFGYLIKSFEVQVSKREGVTETTVSFDILEPGLLPGMVVEVTNANHSLSADEFPIKDVTVTWPVASQPFFSVTSGAAKVTLKAAIRKISPPKPYVPVSDCSGTPSLSQQTGIAYTAADATFPDDPSACMQIAVQNLRRTPANGAPGTVPVGYTLADWAWQDGGGSDGTLGISYRVTMAGDPDVINLPGEGADHALIGYEFANVTQVQDSATLSDQVSTSPMVSPTVTLTTPGIIFAAFMKGFAGVAGGNTLPNMAISGPATELDWTGTIATDDQGPTIVVGYRVVSAGTYSITATGDTAGFATGAWACVILALGQGEATNHPDPDQEVTEYPPGAAEDAEIPLNYPYDERSVKVKVDGVHVVPVEHDPSTGVIKLPVATTGRQVVVNYKAATWVTTGAGNTYTPPTTAPDIGSWLAGSTDLDDLSDVVITTPAANHTLRYVGGQWINDDRRWEPVTHNPGGGPELVWDGDSLVMEWKEY